MPEIKLTAPLEVGLCVSDLEAMQRFYRDLLGMRYVSTFEVAAELGKATTFSSSGYTIVRLQLNSGERLKLVRPGREPSPAAAEEVLERGGIAFLTFIVDDLQGLLDRLREAAVKVTTGEHPIELRPGVFVAFAVDPEGNQLELVEYADLAAYRDDLGRS